MYACVRVSYLHLVRRCLSILLYWHFDMTFVRISARARLMQGKETNKKKTRNVLFVKKTLDNYECSLQ